MSINAVTVVAGPSGVGKGTLVKALLQRYPDDVCVSVSATTRQPRPGEVDGQHYFFLSEDQFDQLIAQDKMLEWAQYGSNRYGTPRAFVEEQLARGYEVILEIDMQGVDQVRAHMPNARLVFIAPPCPQELVRRLQDRGTETPEAVAQRLAIAEKELARQDEFHRVIINSDICQATDELAEFMALA